jgi:hypothetical protein
MQIAGYLQQDQDRHWGQALETTMQAWNVVQHGIKLRRKKIESRKKVRSSYKMGE